MLTRADLLNIPNLGLYIVDGEPGPVVHREAMIALQAGRSVAPADASTLERIADKTPDPRGAMFRRLAGRDVPAPPAAAPTLRPEAPAAPEFDAAAESARVRAVIEAAEGNPNALRDLAIVSGIRDSGRWGVNRLTTEINKAASARIAAGQPAKI